jgi:argininosuccinate synthase
MSTVVLACSGGFLSSLAVRWLAGTHAAEVVAVTLDVGQGEDLSVLRGRALSCGAVRAHAIDAREELARDYLIPSLASGAFVNGRFPAAGELIYALIARKLVDVARIEGSRVVAHGSLDPLLDDCIRAIDPAIDIVAPAREWRMDDGPSADDARLPVCPGRPADPYCRIDQSLWGRVVSWRDGDAAPDAARPPATPAPEEPAHVEVAFEHGVPVSINGVPMSPVELVESLALIAGRHGIGRLEGATGGRRVVYDAPAAMVLHAAYAAALERAGTVRLSLLRGEFAVLTPLVANTVVTHA